MKWPQATKIDSLTVLGTGSKPKVSVEQGCGLMSLQPELAAPLSWCLGPLEVPSISSLQPESSSLLTVMSVLLLPLSVCLFFLFYKAACHPR